MTLEVILFAIFSTICAVSAVLMITRPSPVISALFLVLNFCSLAGLYLTLNAQFIAVAQVIVYAGAIMVFFLFVIMLLNPETERKFFEHKAKLRVFIIVIVALVLIQIIYVIFLSKPSQTITSEASRSIETGTVENIGREMFTNYVLPFEAAGYLLLAATIGALVLAKKKFE
jgi:NADH-quinone oxidoreductase subunit J